eukprot:1658009-Pyramimonas_sp.AAC.2
MALASLPHMSQKLVERLGAEEAVRYMEGIGAKVAARLTLDMGTLFFTGLPGMMDPPALVRPVPLSIPSDHDGPIRRRKRGYILTRDQSNALLHGAPRHDGPARAGPPRK